MLKWKNGKWRLRIQAMISNAIYDVLVQQVSGAEVDA